MPKINDVSSSAVTIDEHANAKLAFLIDVLFHDSEMKEIASRLKALAGRREVIEEDPEAVAMFVSNEAKILGLPSIALAHALIQWFNEGDVSPATLRGSANWALTNLRTSKPQLFQSFQEINSQVVSAFGDGRNDPENLIDKALELHRELGNKLRKTRAELAKMRGRRKNLFYALSRTEVQAYYWTKLRKKGIDHPAVQDLLAESEEVYDLRSRDERIKAQKKLHDWSRRIASLITEISMPDEA